MYICDLIHENRQDVFIIREEIPYKVEKKEIIDNIKDTVEIEKIIKPIYNFKAKD